MISFVRGIFFDQLNKVQKMLDDLETHPAAEHVDQEFFSRTLEMLIGLRAQLTHLISSGDLEIEVLSANNIIRYNTFHEELLNVELFRYLIIINYGEAEAYFRKKIVRIYHEINCLQKQPIVTTISNSESYFWALPTHDLIAVPAKEEKNLLNLPDIFHEMGHLIFHQFESFLIGDIHQQVIRFYQDEIQRVDDEQRPQELKTFFKIKSSNWLTSWVMEFACDFVATYLVGPAYAWTNLKISTLSSGTADVYGDSLSHPSDEARMRGIFFVLRLLGEDKQVTSVEDSWNQFLGVTINPKPSNYDFIFPQEIIEALAISVVQGCRDIDLRDFIQQASEHPYPISKLLNEAWQMLLADPAAFEAWEKARIAEIAAV